LKGKRVVVVGSLTPWYESVALAAGAESVTTIEYNKLDYDHPSISTVTNAEWYGPGGGHERGERFDVILSISSFEHDGLGRYGDKVDPDADIEGGFEFITIADFSRVDMVELLAWPTPLNPCKSKQQNIHDICSGQKNEATVCSGRHHVARRSYWKGPAALEHPSRLWPRSTSSAT
jgi:hypothetical protein